MCVYCAVAVVDPAFNVQIKLPFLIPGKGPGIILGAFNRCGAAGPSVTSVTFGLRGCLPPYALLHRKEARGHRHLRHPIVQYHPIDRNHCRIFPRTHVHTFPHLLRCCRCCRCAYSYIEDTPEGLGVITEFLVGSNQPGISIALNLVSEGFVSQKNERTAPE